MDDEQPERLADDPGVAVDRDGADHLWITVGDDVIRVSRYNAWRVFGMLAFILGIRLPPALTKKIRT